MAGSHQRGIEAAQSNLYEQGFTFLIRGRKTKPQSYDAVKTFWKKMTPRLVEVTAAEHDKIVSEISHLPHVVALCLVLSVEKRFLRFAASGFRDATRMAQGHPSIWLPILKTNRPALERVLTSFEHKIHTFRKMLSSRRYDRIRQMLVTAFHRRQQI
jgi:prephenate dehydrogenase